MKKQILKGIGIILSIAILWFMISDFIEHWQSIRPYLLNMNVILFILSIVIYSIAFIFVGYNWAYLLWKMDFNNNKIDYLNIHMVSALARYLPGGIWSIVGKAMMCKNIGVGSSKITVSMILEYVFQIASSALFFILFIPTFIKIDTNMIIIIGAVFCTLILLYLMPMIIDFGTRMVARFFKADFEEIRLNKKYLYNVLLRFILTWLITGMGVALLTKSFAKISYSQAIYLVLSYPISWVVGFLSPSPNGMGVREGVLAYFLGMASNGYNHDLILLVTLSTRIWTILGEGLAFLGFKIFYTIHIYMRNKNEKIA